MRGGSSITNGALDISQVREGMIPLLHIVT